jgi:hypothetical protein
MAGTSALISRLSPAEDQGWNMGIKESVSAFARIAGPAAAGPIFEGVGPGAPLVIAGGLAALNLLSILRLAARLRGQF